MKYITKKLGFLYSLFFMVLSITFFDQVVLHHHVAAKDVLNPGEELNSLNSTSTLVSAFGKFSLGFFTTPSNSFTYLGIWPRNSFQSNQKVWVANRDKPMINVSGILVIDESGTLKVVSGKSRSTLFNIFYNQAGSSKNTRAILHDSGNFVVYDEENQTLWQSFDHPTDTLLAGMKLGYNLTSRQNWTLTSWSSEQIPATGIFTMRLEQYKNSPQILIYRYGDVHRASGPWKNGSFQSLNSMVDFSFPAYYYQNLITDPSGSMYIITYDEVLYNIQLTAEGEIIDNGESHYDPSFCYGYNFNDGCVVPQCRGHNDSFQWKSGDWIANPDNENFEESIADPYNTDNNSNINLNDCMERCWNDCNCVGFITANSNGTGCSIWHHYQNYFEEDIFGNTDKKYVLLSSQGPQPRNKKKTWKWIVVSLASMFTFVLAAIFFYIRIKRHRLAEKETRKIDDFINQLTSSNSFNTGDELEKGFKDAPDVKFFSLKAVLEATNNFSNENKLGKGGYGPVYRGELSDGRKIAVKRLSKTSGQGIQEFKSELLLISKLQHTNLVRLYGCCIHEEEKMLIYEFMPNKSLDFFIFAKNKKEKIDWKIRFNIIEGIAQGLLYLHKFSRMRVIHRDLKASNILLDENMNPKIADFGMARIFQQNVTEAMTNKIGGTYGYMAPEYAMQGTFSIKSDVFSFGVLILEIVSGKKNSSFHNYDTSLSLVGFAWELWKRDAALELKDEALGEIYDVKQLLRSIHIGLLCVQENANDRPTMSEVIYMFNNENLDLPIPKQPAFFTKPNDVQSSKSTDQLLGNNIQVSANGLTLTTMVAR